MSVTRGRFVTLEGIEGAGKSTLSAALLGALRDRGLAVCATREPGGTPLAERIRTLALERHGEALAPAAETCLMFAARAVHLDNLIRPTLRAGQWVLCDRFTDATRAYQGAGRGVAPALIEQLAAAVHPDDWPDRTLLLDLPVEPALARVQRRGGEPDRFESERSEFFERVRARYLAIARAEPARVRVIDASLPPAALLAAALGALADWLPA